MLYEVITMGYAVSLDARNIPFGIINKSNTKEAHALVSAFVGSPFFNTQIGLDKRELIEKVQNSKLKGIMEIPENFAQNRRYELQLLIDATEPNTGGLLQNYASQIIRQWALEEQVLQAEGVKITPRYWFNPAMSSRYFLLPGSIAVIMTLIGTLLTALVIAREWA